ncbi:hypothetical protein LMG7974_00214 [Campylobacter majalis]|uniref:Uncharacterized protein n=1 Tax=Campylobacter majalis TaxID=2790656 RepID=A0ABN7K4F5_9BACT|nr:hypothetical protein LMG7974_00214 [Campylobacter majalis]
MKYDLGIPLEQYHFLMSLSGVLCGFLFVLIVLVILSKM